MNATRLPAGVLASLPPEWPEDPTPLIRSALKASHEKVVVLDDDPTGTQTVHGIPVLTEWSVDALKDELQNSLPAFYLLTNTRSVTLEDARATNSEIGRNLSEAARQARRKFVVVSRSDSTLRGHFPGEVEALAEQLGGRFDAWLIVPFFLEGGRYTLDNVHYVAEGDWLTPAGETEFARDKAFGYHSSDLRAWVEEKTGGRVRHENVAAISLTDLREGGPVHVAAKLAELSGGVMCVVNAASMRDLEVLTLALLSAEGRGKRFLYRTAASFVPARSGIEPRPLLTPDDFEHRGPTGGLVVVGSYVPRTTEQVSRLIALPHVKNVEIAVDDLLHDSTRSSAIALVARQADDYMGAGDDVVLYTSRHLVSSDDPAESLQIGGRISSALVAIVRAIRVRPRYFLAKGGITSSDMATKGLDVKRAMVLGQLIPGVPVWKTGPESRYPGLTYLVFPGNVGDPNALADAVTALMR
jgi:uncharacterized protein YgbK (DUF1537 family)